MLPPPVFGESPLVHTPISSLAASTPCHTASGAMPPKVPVDFTPSEQPAEGWNKAARARVSGGGEGRVDPGHGRTDLGARLDSLAARRAAERLLRRNPESIRRCVVLGGLHPSQHTTVGLW
jgi:hypothetical protein